MAIGLALMIGFVFPENFADPYTSKSITEFWQRWHMSLSNWLREYLYIPLGGNRKGTVRTYINLFLTMLLGGLWHGANWTFVVWGAWHGTLLAIERYSADRWGASRWPGPLRVMRTMLWVMMGWVFFRAADLAHALEMLKGLAGLHACGLSPALAWQVVPDRLACLVLGVLLVYLMPWIRRLTGMPQVLLRFALIPLFLWAVATLSAQSFTPFLYFQF